MADTHTKTNYAPAARRSEDTVRKQHHEIVSQPFVQKIMDSLPYAACIINEERQVVFSNSTLLDMVDTADSDEYLGLRPGEMFGCIHADKGPSGCGTSNHCRVCGAVQVVLESQKENRNVSRECRITSKINGSDVFFDLRVSSTPINIGSQRFLLVNMTDISHEKRRRQLEQVFFHDILNSAGNIFILSELSMKKPEKSTEAAPMIFRASEQLLEDINIQKDLLAAENDRLIIDVKDISSKECLEFTIQTYSRFASDRSVHIHLDPASEDIMFRSDRSLLLRVLGNMLKNAIEASGRNETVTAGYYKDDDNVLFCFNNSQYMPEDIQLQIFQRSFSTRGKGRGTGTYVIKLFSEKYLGGRASFTSSKEGGTTFTITLPQSIQFSSKSV